MMIMAKTRNFALACSTVCTDTTLGLYLGAPSLLDVHTS